MEVKRENYQFKEQEVFLTPLTTLALLTLLIFFFTLIGSGIIFLIGSLKGVDFQLAIQSLSEQSSSEDRNFIRSLLSINHLFTFIIPAVVFAVFLFRKTWTRFLKLDRIPSFQNIALGSLILLVALPLAQFSYWLNKKIPLPEWASSMEANTNSMVQNLLIVDAPYELLFNLIVIALIPAIGEEFVFRGIIQQKLGTAFKNKVTAIWVTAIIFSAIHLQFQGFIPRLILGALLGYLFYWTNNLWIPIIAHFFNNALQIVLQYLYQQQLSPLDIDNTESLPIWLSIISVIFVFVLGHFMKRHNHSHLEI